MTPNQQFAQILQHAWEQRRAGNYVTAHELVEQARKLCPPDDYLSLGYVYHYLAQFERDHKNFPQALEWTQESLRCYQLTGKPDRIAHATRHLADLEIELEMLTEAEHHYAKAIEWYRTSAETTENELANALRGLALLLEKKNKLQEAKTVWEEVRELYQTVRVYEGVEEAEAHLTVLE